MGEGEESKEGERSDKIEERERGKEMEGKKQGTICTAIVV